MLIDSHVNLHSEAFAEDRDAVIAAARAAGVGCMITICDRLDNAEAVTAIAAREPDIAASIGVHPHHAKNFPDLSAQQLIALAQRPEVAAIGETGLDLHYGYSPLTDQLRSLHAHIEAARALDLPLIIHTREADQEMAQALEEAYARGPFRILLHCYTSGPDLLRAGLALGAVVSFSGILTFKNAHDVRARAREVPLDRVILETDCPYLAPVPHRGRRCTPAMVADVYRAFAELRGVEAQALEAQIAETFFGLFRKAPRPE